MVPDEAEELAELECQRDDLYWQLGHVRDFRRGSLNEVRRNCGKPNCACAQPGPSGAWPAVQRGPVSERQDGDAAFEAGAGAGEGPARGGRVRAILGTGGEGYKGE